MERNDTSMSEMESPNTLPPNNAAPRHRGLGDQAFAALLVLPAGLLVAGLAVWPIVRVIWLSFHTQNLSTSLQPRFSGLSNYIRLVQDGQFLGALWVTTIFTVISVLLELVLGLILALLLNQRFAGRAAARASALIPWALPTAVLALAWQWIFNDRFGVLNDLLLRVGLISQPIVWLQTGPWAMFSLILADVWKTTPFMTVILLAGLQNIPQDLYEAIRVDGAGAWRAFRLITLPLLTPSIMVAALFRMIQSFGIFDLPWVMTGGSTETVAIYTYNTYLRYFDFGYGSAVIVGTVIVMGILAVAIYWPLSRTRGFT